MSWLRPAAICLACAGFWGHGATLENGSIRLRLESGSLSELRDIRSGQNFAAPGQSLWELQFRSGSNELTLAASEARDIQQLPLSATSFGKVLVWSGFPAPFPSDLTVKAEVRVDPRQAMSRWRITVEGLRTYALTQVRFPILQPIPEQPHEQLAVPVWMGQVTAEPRRVFRGTDRKGRRSQWHYPGELSMQSLAFWGENAGLYVATSDTAAFRKAFAVFGDGSGGLGCDLVHFPEIDRVTNGRWALPYEVELGTFHGDWFTAAGRYRAWATNQSWALESRLARGIVPPWVTNTALWVWNRGRSDGVLPPAATLQRQLGLPVSVLWHWWHGCAYDVGFPEYLPPREGTDAFEAALNRAHRQGIHALVYMNQRLWGMTTESWKRENAEAWAVMGLDGKIHPEIYNTFTKAKCASMCLGTPFWQNKYAGLAEAAVTGLGVDGIYMDQTCLSLACYDPSHGHPLGGGTYWAEGSRLLAADIRERCADRLLPGRGRMRAEAPALAGEGCGEPWLPQLDLMLSLQVSKERYATPDGWDPIPFFQTVYHPYAVLFGNYSSLTMPPYDELWPAEFAPSEPLKLLERKFASQFCLEQARAFVWGQQPTVANFRPDQLRSRAGEIAYVRRLARLRARALPYLLQGTLLKAPQIAAPEATIPLSRLSIYAGQRGGLKTYEKKVPLALGAAWRAPGGQVAVALASIADERLPVRLTVGTKEYGLSPGAGITRLEDRGVKKHIGIVGSSQTSVEMELPRRGACIIEFGKN